MSNLALTSNVTQFSTKVGKSIEGFLYEKAKQSQDTATAYRGDIKRFLSDVYDKSITTITAEELEVLDYDAFKSFLDGYFDKQLNSVANRYASSIKSLYRYLCATKAIKCDISFFDLINKAKEQPNSYDVMPMEIVFMYIEATRFEKNKQLEKKMAIKTAVELGLRESEIRALEWSQFKKNGEEVYISGYGKGNVKYLDVVDVKFYEELLELKVEGQKNIFTLSKKNIIDMMVRLKKQLNQEDRNYTFHSFKKTAVNNTFLQTGNIRDAQAKGKHAHTNTTELYLAEAQLKMTGYFSLEGKIKNNNLYREVSNEVLVNTIKGMSKEMLFLLNLKLQENEQNK